MWILISHYLYGILFIVSTYAGIVFFGFLSVLLVASYRLYPRRYDDEFIPSVSVVIPFYNEEGNVVSCLDSVLESDYPRNKLEVICVDDGSDDKTLHLLHEYAVDDSRLQIIESDHSGKAAAMNLGIKRAENEILISLDADTTITENYIREVVKPFFDVEISFVVTPLYCKDEDSILGYMQAIEYSFINIFRGAFTRIFGQPLWVLGAVFVIRRKSIMQVGMYSGDIAIDLDLLLKLVADGYKAAYCSGVAAVTRPKNLLGFVRQRMRWNFGIFLNLRRYFCMGSPVYLFSLFGFVLWVFNSFLLVSHIVFLMFLNLFFGGDFLLMQIFYLTNFSVILHYFYDFRPLVLILQMFVLSYYGVSLCFYKRDFSFRGFVALMLYPSYFLLLHVASVFSFVKYSMHVKDRWRW